ncbi:aldo/keto reductase [Bacillus sp. MUM 13]|uniref:aldo/keto reductase n=1 Tax=Bacillus sp. MUM 13 TaxID=1678001 RepID=UPI0008F5F579|nr:aldo/keto reductase [Bacillus sp. MUM 13]OIK08263.1 hypothetical protein BIV59_20440 [Bacillus sp. MUM 13]
MEKRRLGKTNLQVGVLGFGGSEIGLEKVDFSVVDRLLNTALDNDLNVIDTAECYGISEELIGKAVSHRRSDYFLFTKCGHASGLPFEDFDKTLIEVSVDRSLKRLNTEYIDVVHLHGASKEIIDNGELLEELTKLKNKGKVRFVGYSGDGYDALHAVKSNYFDTLQTSLNIADQEAIELIMPAVKKLDIGVIAKRPIANAAWKDGNRIRSKYERQMSIAKRTNNQNILSMGKPTKLTYLERLEKLNYDFLNQENDKQIAEYALRFTLTVPDVHIAIIGTKKPERWMENLGYLNGPLPEVVYNKIRAQWIEKSEVNWSGMN